MPSISVSWRLTIALAWHLNTNMRDMLARIAISSKNNKYHWVVLRKIERIPKPFWVKPTTEVLASVLRVVRDSDFQSIWVRMPNLFPKSKRHDKLLFTLFIEWHSLIKVTQVIMKLLLGPGMSDIRFLISRYRYRRNKWYGVITPIWQKIADMVISRRYKDISVKWSSILSAIYRRYIGNISQFCQYEPFKSI